MHLFAYGTLMCPEIIIRVIGFCPPSAPARLAHYRRGPLLGVEYPAITPQKNAAVTGLLYLDLPPKAWPRLDEFEDRIYYRCTVDVTIEQGEIRSAETYVLRPEHLDRLGESEWDFSEFLDSGRMRFEQEYGHFPEPEGR